MYRSALPALFLLLTAPLARAETVTLGQAVQAAVAARPLVQAARQDASAAKAAVGEARSRYFPRITLGENFTWTDEPAGSLFINLNQQELELSSSADPYNFPPARKDFETRLTLEQPLFDTDIAYRPAPRGGRRRGGRGRCPLERRGGRFRRLSRLPGGAAGRGRARLGKDEPARSGGDRAAERRTTAGRGRPEGG